MMAPTRLGVNARFPAVLEFFDKKAKPYLLQVLAQPENAGELYYRLTGKALHCHKRNGDIKTVYGPSIEPHLIGTPQATPKKRWYRLSAEMLSAEDFPIEIGVKCFHFITVEEANDAAEQQNLAIEEHNAEVVKSGKGERKPFVPYQQHDLGRGYDGKPAPKLIVVNRQGYYKDMAGLSPVENPVHGFDESGFRKKGHVTSPLPREQRPVAV